MKLALAIVPEPDVESVVKMLTSSKFSVTRISPASGFLRCGHAILLIGVEAEKIRECIRLIRECSPPAIDSALKHVVVFVLKVDQFEQI
jgi:uncharacterized protein YaaQ